MSDFFTSPALKRQSISSVSSCQTLGSVEQQWLGNYNTMIEYATQFYTSLEPFQDTTGTPTKNFTSPPTSRRGRPLLSEAKQSLPEKIEIRRAQNRASQRAYRERRERRQKDLENQFAQWHLKHQDLCRSYSKQVEQVARLKAQIEKLSSEISAVRTGLPHLGNGLPNNLDFDLVPWCDDDGHFLV